MRIGVVGGAGFIGSRLAKQLHAAGHDVIALDIRRHEFIRTATGDVCDRDFVIDAVTGLDGLYYLAGLTKEAFEKAPAKGMLLEVTGVQNVLEAARAKRVKRFIYASSFLVYSGLGNNDRTDETATLLSQNMTVFGAGKLFIERMIATLCSGTDISWTCCRLGSTYGADERCTNMVYHFLQEGLRGNTIEIWGSGQRCCQFTHVDDLAKGLARCFEACDERILNLCSPERVTVRELAEMLTIKYGAQFRYRTDKQDPPSGPYISSSRAQDKLNWHCATLADRIGEMGCEMAKRKL